MNAHVCSHTQICIFNFLKENESTNGRMVLSQGTEEKIQFIVGRRKNILITLNRKCSHLILRVCTICYFQNTESTRTNQSLVTCATVVPTTQNRHLYLSSYLDVTVQTTAQLVHFHVLNQRNPAGM